MRTRRKPRAGSSRPGGARCCCRATSRIARIAANIVAKTVETFGRIDVLVNNAAYQMTYDSLEEISDDEWDKTFSTNIGAMFCITKAARAAHEAGRAIVNTTSVNADTSESRR